MNESISEFKRLWKKNQTKKESKSTEMGGICGKHGCKFF